ncbi:hypothetical protein MSAS_31660 [Mycobacterium saskatchewanense]|nr:hypothetical protein MSAS_31660 [Mycobacterium saskatchewanense]
MGGTVHRTLVAAMALAFACWPALPRAAADNPVCTPTECSFLSPSHNISCEVNFKRNEIPDETYCQTNSPPQSVTMTTSGSFKTCTGDSCLGNAAQGTPTLAYGQNAGVGPFNCRSETDGVTCTVTSGRGFTLSTAGITSVG